LGGHAPRGGGKAIRLVERGAARKKGWQVPPLTAEKSVAEEGEKKKKSFCRAEQGNSPGQGDRGGGGAGRRKKKKKGRYRLPWARGVWGGGKRKKGLVPAAKEDVREREFGYELWEKVAKGKKREERKKKKKGMRSTSRRPDCWSVGRDSPILFPSTN